MGKRIVFILLCLLLVICVAGCGEKEPADNSVSYDWESYYEAANYDKYKTPAFENGLDGTLIWVEGEIIKVDTVDEYIVYMLEDKDKNIWILGLANSDKQGLSLGEHVKAYGTYMGTSGVYNKAPFLLLLRYIHNNNLTNISVELYTSFEGLSQIERKSIARNTTGISTEPEENTPPATKEPPKPIEQQPTMTADEIERFNSYTGKIQGSTFVKEATVSGNVATITYSTYDEFKALNPDSTISEEDYSIYWGLNDAINKVLMEEPIRILREFPGLQQVNMKIPFEGKIHKVQLDRNAIEKYLNVDLEEIHNDTSLDLWREKIAKKFFNKEERAKFVEKFVTVS